MLRAGPLGVARDSKMDLLVPVPGQEGDWSMVQPSRGKAARNSLASAVPGRCWLSNKALAAFPLAVPLQASTHRKAQGTTRTFFSTFPSLYWAPQFIFHT